MRKAVASAVIILMLRAGIYVLEGYLQQKDWAARAVIIDVPFALMLGLLQVYVLMKLAERASQVSRKGVSHG